MYAGSARAAALGACMGALVLASPAADSSSTTRFDYVIVGGGTAGLVLANRLSENPSVTVAVIEPGGDQRNNPNVTDPEDWVNNIGSSIDWQYDIVPQDYYGTKSRALVHSAGRAIGGTSCINGMTYVRAQTAQIDAWEKLGNPGWNWRSMWPYYLKYNTFQPPSKSVVDNTGVAYNPNNYGHGPVQLGWEWEMYNGSMHTIQNETWQKLGYKYNPDVNGGNELGFTIWPREVNRKLNTRSDSATAFYYPLNRPNLKLFKGFVTKVVFADGGAHKGNLTATGVQYNPAYPASGPAATLSACKEVILSAGALKSSSLLELSGIGNPAVLSRFGIKTLVNNTGVGEHMQDQPNAVMVWDAAVNGSTPGVLPYVTYASTQDLFRSDFGQVAARTKANIPRWAAQASARGNGSVSTAAWTRIFQSQWELLFQQGIPAAEILNTRASSPPVLITAAWPLIPFSRGNVHIASADATQKPRIDYNYYAVGYDMDVSVAIGRETRRFYGTQPMAPLVGTELTPGLAKVPENATEAQWAAFIGGDFNPNYHAVSTAAMLPRELGGVVDPRLLVYGTSNLRVVDASVMPTQVSGHLTATVYAIAERAAAIIMGKA